MNFWNCRIFHKRFYNRLTFFVNSKHIYKCNTFSENIKNYKSVNRHTPSNKTGNYINVFTFVILWKFHKE